MRGVPADVFFGDVFLMGFDVFLMAFTPDRHSMPTEMKRRKELACSILRS
jgi:hypothetical protein